MNSSFCLSSGAVHDSLPFLLPLARPWRLHASVQWQRPAHAALGQRVQVGIRLFHTFVIIIRGLTGDLTFNSLPSKYDLYTKTPNLPDVNELKPYYQSLIDKYCPGILKWWPGSDPVDRNPPIDHMITLWNQEWLNVLLQCNTKAGLSASLYFSIKS